MPINNQVPEVNAGSMADIAFLLLIFFLVTTTLETDEGLNRLLPPDQDIPEIVVHERNVFRVQLNDANQLLVEGEVLELADLKHRTTAFLDNGGIIKGAADYCDYCKGDRASDSSDNPHKAIIYLEHTRATSYGTYIAVQNELVAAYNGLRNRESLNAFGEGYVAMEQRFYDEKTTPTEKEILKKQIKQIQGLFPQKIIESNANENNNPHEKI